MELTKRERVLVNVIVRYIIADEIANIEHPDAGTFARPLTSVTEIVKTECQERGVDSQRVVDAISDVYEAM